MSKKRMTVTTIAAPAKTTSKAPYRLVFKHVELDQAVTIRAIKDHQKQLRRLRQRQRRSED